MFSPEEIDLLMQGLDSIEKSASAIDVMGELFILGMARDDEHREQIKRERDERRREQEVKARGQRMRINVLKGKLAQIALEVQSEAPFGLVSTMT